MTFDDGPHPEYTNRLLDVLDRYNAKATFFVEGRRIKKNFDILERRDRNGHCIGNHSWEHKSFPLQKAGERRRQIRKSRKALGKFDSGLIRPPFGHLNFETSLDIFYHGYRVIGWSVDAEDWMRHSADSIHGQLSVKIKPGIIALLHDNLIFSEKEDCFDRSQTIAAVDRLLFEMRGYEFVTVSQLLKVGKPVYRPWRIPVDRDWIAGLIQSDH